MKSIDYSYFLPIDKFKIYANQIVRLEYRKEVYTCRINPLKIPYEDIDELSLFEQQNYLATVERVLNLTEFKESKFKLGFEDIQLKLSNIGNVFKI